VGTAAPGCPAQPSSAALLAAQPFITKIAQTAGAPSFAFFAKGGSVNLDEYLPDLCIPSEDQTTENREPQTENRILRANAPGATPKLHYPGHPEEAESLARERLPTKDLCTFPHSELTTSTEPQRSAQMAQMAC